MKRIGVVSTPPGWDVIYTRGWIETIWTWNVLPKNTMQKTKHRLMQRAAHKPLGHRDLLLATLNWVHNDSSHSFISFWYDALVRDVIINQVIPLLQTALVSSHLTRESRRLSSNSLLPDWVVALRSNTAFPHKMNSPFCRIDKVSIYH